MTTKRQISFKGSFSNGAEHTSHLTVTDNYQGTQRAAVVVDKHAMYTPADIDALIAALREARNALAEPVRETGVVAVDATVLPEREFGSWNRQLEAQRYGAPSRRNAPRATPRRS